MYFAFLNFVLDFVLCDYVNGICNIVYVMRINFAVVISVKLAVFIFACVCLK